MSGASLSTLNHAGVSDLMKPLSLVASSKHFCGFVKDAPPTASILDSFSPAILALVDETNEFLAIASSTGYQKNDQENVNLATTHLMEQATQLLLKWDALPISTDTQGREVRTHYVRKLDAYQ